ncbi:MAG: hypothetical protein GQ538_02865 [Xanthomonadales bacterium]|nr:hypothetical protein [Xanthomonadales bacterium]
MSLFKELKRRNVFKVAIAYMIVGWLLLQVSDTLVPALHLPDWFHSGVAFVLILGFPLAIIFAWAFEITPDGLRKEKEVDQLQSITQTTGQKLNFTIIALLIAALAYFAWDKFVPNPGSDVDMTQTVPAIEKTDLSGSSAARKSDKKSIAVIPFQNRSANEENAAFFSDGVHDELLTNLSRIKDLKVISRTSVMSYRDTTKNLRQIGEELGVATVLEGGVQRAGDTVRINVQLIDTATDEHIWAEIYDRQLTAENIFAIQTEIAHAIARALEATLSPQEQILLATTPTTSLEAYDNLLMARQLIDRGNWKSLRDAQSYLKKAVTLDPEFVQAHVLLAKTYSDLYQTGAMTLQEASAPWHQSIQSALTLNPDHAGAIAVQALYLWRHDMEGVEKAFERARLLEPYNAEIMTMYGLYLRNSFLHDRALPIFEMARELDPASVEIYFGLARIRLARWEMSEALEMFAKIRQLDPASVNGYGYVSDIYMKTGDMVQGLVWLFKSMAADPEDSDISNYIVGMYLSFGDLDRAGKWLQWIEQNQNFNPMSVSNTAILSVSEGHLETTMKNVREAIDAKFLDRHSSDSVFVRTLLIWALDHGQTGNTLEIIRQAHPELFGTSPIVNSDNVSQAIDTAQLLQIENLNDEAKVLLQAAVAAYDKPYAVTRTILAPGKAQALALLGEKQAALKELQFQVDRGWRFHWRWNSELNPNFESLREDPEFQAIIGFLRTDMARQLANLRTLEAAGEIPLAPMDHAR